MKKETRNVTDAMIAAIDSITSQNTEVSTQESRVLPNGVWANALTLDGVKVAEQDEKGKYKSEGWDAWKLGCQTLEELCAGNPAFELADVFEAMERCIGRLTAEQYGSLDQQNEAVCTRDPEANLLGEACEMLAGNENCSDTMFIVDGKFKEDTHTRRYGFRFYQVPNSIGCVHLYRQTRDIRPNREGRWQKHEVNGTHMIAYKNAKTGWGWDKRTVGFWMDMVASLGWEPKHMETMVGDHPFYKILID